MIKQISTDWILRGLELNPFLGIDPSGPVPRIITDSSETSVTPTEQGFDVLSATDDGQVYTVTLDGTCTCTAAAERGELCKHIWASVGLECAVLLLSLRVARDYHDCNRMLDEMQPHIDAAPRRLREIIERELDHVLWSLAIKDVKPLASRRIQ
jgi:hypothetical protein